MIKAHRNYHDKYFLALVFVSIIFFSVGMAAHNAFAETVTGTIQVGARPSLIGVNQITDKIYVTNVDDRTVSVIDGSTNSVVSTIPVGSSPFGIGLNPNTNMIYVANYDDSTVSVIDGSTNSVVSTIPVEMKPEGIAVNPNTNMIYVAHAVSRSIAVIDGSTNTIIKTIDLNDTSGEITVNPDTNKIYAGGTDNFQNSGYLFTIDGADNTLVDTMKIGNLTGQVAVNTATNTVYVSADKKDIYVVDGSNNSIIGTISVGSNPFGIGINPETNKIYVAKGDNNTVAVIDGSTNSITSTIPVGSNPVGVAVNPNTNKIYVTNSDDNTVSVISSSPAPSATLSASFATWHYGFIHIYGNIQNPISGVNQTQLLVYAPNGNLVLNNTEPTAFDTGYDISRSEGKGNYTITLTYDHMILAKNSLTSWINNDPIFGFIDPHEASDGSVSVSSLVGYDIAGEPVSVTISDSTNTTLANYTAPTLLKGQFVFGINSATAKQIFTKSGNYTIVLTHIPTGVQGKAILAYTISATTPPAPQNPQTNAGNSQVALTWFAPPNNGGSPITTYNVYRGTSSGSEILLTQAGNVTSYNDGTVTNGQTYFYTVTAVNSVGESIQSNEVSATPIGPPQPPTGLIATGALLKINLNWTAPGDNGGSPITGYMIERSNNGGSTWSTLVTDTGTTSTTYSDTHVLPLKTYTYRVSAINDVGVGSPSNTSSASIPSVSAPSKLALP